MLRGLAKAARGSNTRGVGTRHAARGSCVTTCAGTESARQGRDNDATRGSRWEAHKRRKRKNGGWREEPDRRRRERDGVGVRVNRGQVKEPGGAQGEDHAPRPATDEQWGSTRDPRTRRPKAREEYACEEVASTRNAYRHAGGCGNARRTAGGCMGRDARGLASMSPRRTRSTTPPRDEQRDLGRKAENAWDAWGAIEPITSKDKD
ncbi:eukaryotic translation initiation factor 3subunit C [Striga asiatica]|uniref:Eukaryotic translation initiation factor 3subunit C n=1 Tax=Striga asiatica TaxID=4170 RepID=A0A5A7RAH8_STRAF|nr:eukaryotic translation initiation factor 3subunit C [Striga asiatica]